MLDGDDLHHYGRSRIKRSDFLAYLEEWLTLHPADILDFRTRLQLLQLILAKGNPHFFCDARVLVKPYKEKGKVPDSPRMLYNTNEMLMRRKLEQAELQQAMELYSRKLMGMHLFYGNKHHRRNLSIGTGSVPSPIHSHTYVNQNFMILTSSPGQSSPMTQLEVVATSLSLSTIADNVSKPQAELDRGDNDTEENSKHGDNNTHVRSDMDEVDMEEASTSGRESFNDHNILE
ncbi:hypothetical protein IFM89_036688 [Coptis chinensis]|uniref:Uncharacterized protein n=1 Tax=Coptis chinensis TaxID=261450 RepID=A0A835LY69_9MAGN|nr:hypothetical protein IFM89_036688 [Coptis chinensis]